MNACSWWPDVILWINQTACCFRHDSAYDAQDPRLVADFDLFSCIAALDGHSTLAAILAIIVFIGVRVFGGPFYRRAAGVKGASMLSNDMIATISAVALKHDLPPPYVLAVVQKESAGRVFYEVDGRNVPAMLFEPHIFFRRLSGEKQKRAVAEGLAYERQGMKAYPKSIKDRYIQLERAKMIDEQAAYESCSWGVFQIMGFHWKLLGFASVKEMVDLCMTGVQGQVEVGIRFIEKSNLAADLRAGRLTQFARGYNGKGFKKNNYDTDLKRYAAMYAGSATAVDEPPKGMLRMGSTGRRVAEMQTLLRRAGYAVNPDRDFGPTTKAAVEDFQRKNGLEVDGIYGPETERLLGSFREAAADKPGKQKLLDISLVKKGAAAIVTGGVSATQLADAKTAVEGAAAELIGTGIQNVVMDYVVTGLTIGGVVLGLAGGAAVVYGWLHEKKTILA